jgi:hypothetical protein
VPNKTSIVQILCGHELLSFLSHFVHKKLSTLDSASRLLRRLRYASCAVRLAQLASLIVRLVGIEPTASVLSGQRSTTELQARMCRFNPAFCILSPVQTEEDTGKRKHGE